MPYKMISIVITSFKEPKTIGKAINSFLNQKPKNFEIIVSAPDKETLNQAKKYKIKTIKDSGKGKPSALNNTIPKTKGEIIILSDGDVFTSENSIKELTKHFKNKKIGAVSAKVIPTNSKNSLFGFWAYILSQGFHSLRLNQSKNNKNIICSGYCYAIKKELFQKIPEEILADDAFISLKIISQGFKTIYEPNAEVYVKYPTNLPDWIRQKKRTASRLYQLNQYFKISKLNSFKEEFYAALKSTYELKSFRHLFYFILLIVLKIYIWLRVFLDIRLWKREFNKVWQRVESTK